MGDEATFTNIAISDRLTYAPQVVCLGRSMRISELKQSISLLMARVAVLGSVLHSTCNG
jgi:hypothetical protein